MISINVPAKKIDSASGTEIDTFVIISAKERAHWSDDLEIYIDINGTSILIEAEDILGSINLLRNKKSQKKIVNPIVNPVDNK